MKKLHSQKLRDVSSEKIISLQADSEESRWITIGKNNEKISEGVTPKDAIKEAEKITDDYTVVFMPKRGETYIF